MSTPSPLRRGCQDAPLFRSRHGVRTSAPCGSLAATIPASRQSLAEMPPDRYRPSVPGCVLRILPGTTPRCMTRQSCMHCRSTTPHHRKRHDQQRHPAPRALRHSSEQRRNPPPVRPGWAHPEPPGFGPAAQEGGGAGIRGLPGHPAGGLPGRPHHFPARPARERRLGAGNLDQQRHPAQDPHRPGAQGYGHPAHSGGGRHDGLQGRTRGPVPQTRTSQFHALPGSAAAEIPGRTGQHLEEKLP